MPKNIEIKASVLNRDNLVALVEQIADIGPVEIRQDDTFFRCSNGRLKLRQLSPNHGELILYHRPDVSGPKTSTYVISQTSEPGTMREILSAVLGVAGRVRKRRHLYLCGSTRIHIDDVEGLGNFVELEVVLENSDSGESGRQIAEELMTRLGIQNDDLVEGAYVDLINDIVESSAIRTNSELLGSPLNPNNTFDRFIETNHNQFAFAAAVAVADNPGDTYNPLYIYGRPGVGKSHLLSAIGNAIRKNMPDKKICYYNPLYIYGRPGVGKSHLLSAIGNAIRKNMPDKKICYCGTEYLVNEIESHLRQNQSIPFFYHFQAVDVLLIDNIQFLSGKDYWIQNEFFNMFNALYDQHKQIVIASQMFPSEIPDLHDRLRMRFECGLIADIMTPNEKESDQINKLCDELSKSKWRLTHTPKSE